MYYYAALDYVIPRPASAYTLYMHSYMVQVGSSRDPGPPTDDLLVFSEPVVLEEIGTQLQAGSLASDTLTTALH